MQRDRFGTLTHFAAGVEGRPFQAQFEDTISRTLLDGSIEQRVLKGMIYRDSRGRERRDSYFQAGAQLLLHVASISDPVAKDRFMLDFTTVPTLLE